MGGKATGQVALRLGRAFKLSCLEFQLVVFTKATVFLCSRHCSKCRAEKTNLPVLTNKFSNEEQNQANPYSDSFLFHFLLKPGYLLNG